MKRVSIVVLACACLAVSAYVIEEARRPLKHANDPVAPLTDVAGPAPSADVKADETPERRLARLAAQSPEPPRPRVKYVLPRAMPDVAHPPQWTKPRAVPGPPVPPDPWTPPVATTNPDRGHHSNVE